MGISFGFPRTYLKIIGITASNTWGLLLLVFLMGYGLVEVPRTTWNTARLEFQMAHAYFKISKLSVEKEEAEEQLSEVLEVIDYIYMFDISLGYKINDFKLDTCSYNNRFNVHLYNFHSK